MESRDNALMEGFEAPVALALDAEHERAAETHLLIAVACPVSVPKLVAASQAVFEGLVADIPSLRCVVAYPQDLPAPEMDKDGEGKHETDPRLTFMPYVPPSGEPPVVSSLPTPAALRSIERIAAGSAVGACVIVAPDLAAMDARSIHCLTLAIFATQSEMCLPVYATRPLEDLLNKSILCPLNRALYGRRIRFPLAPDFAVSATMLGTLAEGAAGGGSGSHNALVWPGTEAARAGNRISQTYLGIRHEAQHEAPDLSTVLSGVLGSLFSEMDRNAPIWQRTRGSQAVPTSNTPAAPAAISDAVDARSLIDSFQLGARNLQEVWSLILPPITLLELKHITRLAPDQFHISDALWVRIVYDFALAHRLRTISRSHILGALTPLYLGWVASYVLELGTANPSVAEPRLEALAQAYEAGKPYLLSRWRWPDRFNP